MKNILFTILLSAPLALNSMESGISKNEEIEALVALAYLAEGLHNCKTENKSNEMTALKIELILSELALELDFDHEELYSIVDASSRIYQEAYEEDRLVSCERFQETAEEILSN